MSSDNAAPIDAGPAGVPASAASHTRTLTSLLSSSNSDPGELGRSHSVPGESSSEGAVQSHEPLRPAIISQPLLSTHPGLLGTIPERPPMEHSESEPMPASSSSTTGSTSSSSSSTTTTQPLDRSALKAFDPLAVMSPQLPPPRSLPPAHSPGDSTAASALSSFVVGSDQTISSFNSYSSAALSSGSFTAISVSPVTPLTPGGHLAGSTPGSAGGAVSSPLVPPPAVAAALAAAAAAAPDHDAVSRDFFSASTSSSVPPSGGSASASVSHSHPQMSVDVGTQSSSSGDPKSTSSASSSSSQLSMASLSTSSPSLHTPVVHPSPPASTRSTVGFKELDTTIHEDGSVTTTRAHPPHLHARQISDDATPSVVNVHAEEGPSPANYPRIGISPSRSSDVSAAAAVAGPGYTIASGLLSPSLPQPSSTRSSSLRAMDTDGGGGGGGGEHHDADVDGALSPSNEGLPPVVSRLMTAQKMAGTTPGATLAMPVKSQMGRLIMLVGDASGAGKCWGQGTRLLLPNGRSMAVESIVKEMSRGRVVELQGDDGTIRRTIPGSQTIGHTGNERRTSPSRREAKEAATYRITSKTPGRDSWTCNNRHILVLRFNERPSAVRENGPVADNPFCFDRLEVVRGGVQAADGVWSGGIVERVVQSYVRKDDAEQACAEADATWRPLEWECSVDEFLRCDKTVREVARMFQPERVDFAYAEEKSLRMRLKDAILATQRSSSSSVNLDAIEQLLTPPNIELTAWVIGVWLGSGSAGCSSMSVPSASVLQRLLTWRNITISKPLPSCDALPSSSVAMGAILTHLLTAYDIFHNQQLPHDLLTDLPEVRRSLLAGIIDASGRRQTLSSSSLARFEVTAKQRGFLNSLTHLARGLGFTVGAVEHATEHNKGYLVTIGGRHLHTIETVQVSKRFTLSECSGWDASNDGAFEIKRVAHAAYYGFELDGNGRCLLSDLIVTHNSSVAMGLLHLLLKRGYKSHELAYIKPCTQCEDVQIVSKYCEKQGIAHQGLGPVIFYEGFTAEVIDGKTESVEKRRSRVQAAVNKIAEGKKWVLVDGVGYAAVGSVAGVSNAEVASLLNAPVVVVGRPGVGNAIDAMNFILAYFEKYHVHMVGACWNKLPPMHSYHSYAQCKKYVEKYFRELRNGVISCYGHIPLVEIKAPLSAADAAAAASNDPASPPSDQLVCRLRPAKTDLVLSGPEQQFVSEFLATMEREFDIEQLLGDLNRYYSAHRVQLVSVV